MCYILMGLVLAILLGATWVRQRLRRCLGGLPPGPMWWPVAGNIFQLGYVNVPHESFARLADKYGPIMTLWLGSMCTVVISSSEAAREMFKNHDAALAGRKIYESMKGEFGDEPGSMITAQYGPQWRMLRRLCTTEFFVSARLDASRGVRDKCIDHMLQFIQEAGESGTNGVDVGRFFFLMAFNLIGNLMFSKDLLDSKSEKGAMFFYHARKVMEFAGKPNVADYLPWLRWIDPQSIRRKTQFYVKQAFNIAGDFIKERMERSENGDGEERKKDYLDVLLEYRGDGVEGPSRFSSTTINIIVFEMFTAGTDTTTSTLEWAMAELLRNPTMLKRVQTELRRVVSDPNRKLEEKHMDNLPYLKATIKETLRLHPPLPFLVPHMAMESSEMSGHRIPQGTQILVNVWAIGRDPSKWKDPLEFKPERFMEPNVVDYKGQDFEFIPFGSGRRMCPAIPLVSRVLPMALGSILHKFDWVLANGIRAEEMDMSEKMGITLRKAIPLKAIPTRYEG